MTSPINSSTMRTRENEGVDIMNATFEMSKDLKLADTFGKLVKKADELAQAGL